MKRVAIIAVSLLLICGVIFYYISIPRNISGVTAEGGILNLSGEDFSKTLFRLDGEWEFYYGEFYASEDFINGSPDGSALIKAPMSWDRRVSLCAV